MKKIMILVLLFFVTGCSAEYNLEFHDKILSETINISAFNESITEEQIKNLIESYIPTDNENPPIYQVKQNHKEVQLFAKYNIQSYQKSKLLSQCYLAHNLIDSGDYYDLTTSETFTCNPFDYMLIDELKIKIKTNHKVLSHNADLVEKNTYIWNITVENSQNKPIQIRFSKETKEDNKVLIILGITAIIAIIILMIVFIVSIISKKNNKI